MMKLRYALLMTGLVLASLTATAQTVHYTQTGSKYHSSWCKYLRRSDDTCSLREAFKRGLEPCSKCNPPTKVIAPKQGREKGIKAQTFFYRKSEYEMLTFLTT